ncbi:MAG: hypothetical protein HY376_00410 [Candidatus Blackburnbacteria bacterium]|nr:hypothetical protein [Candidatus Blackburnbacteria bacterium]
MFKRLVRIPFLIAIFLLVVLAGIGWVGKNVVYADDSAEQRLEDIKKKIAETEGLLSQNQKQQVTLANEIAYQDNQIKLTSLKISATEQEIDTLSGQINQLEVSLSDLSNAFSKRVVATYKIAREGTPITLLLTADNVNEFVSRFYYLQRVQKNDHDTLIQLQTTQLNYEVQREKREQLKTKLETQKTKLASQKAQKQQLLSVTKNDEKKFQQLLASAKAELEAIQAIIAGRGSETKVGSISQGSRIASIIQGSSCNSGGAHTHFIVSKNGITENPFNYLKSVDYENCSGSSCNSGDGDPFNPSGSWDWPIAPKIKLTQGYGSTWAVNNVSWLRQIYSFHNGIDINSDNAEVRTVKNGTLYRGSYSGSSGCALRYVRVDHDDSDLDTFYLHINY